MDIIDKELIVRYLSGSASSSENDLVNAWIAESEDNQQFMEDCFFVWQTTGCLQVMRSVKTKEALLSLKDRVKTKNREITVKKYLLHIQQIAAILFIPVLLLSYYFYNKSDNEVIQYMEIRTNPGMISSVVLPDSSKVWLNSSGYLKYPIRFTSKNREVELIGEGYFEITQKENKPFLVKVGDNYSVEVLGTKFNVSAYPEDNKIETTLVEGAVQLNLNNADKKRIQYVLKPNQKATFAENKFSVAWVDPVYEMGWKDGKMYFKNRPMDDVIKRISRHYNVVFDVKNPEILESLITAKFESEQLLQVMEYLRLASGIQYKIHKTNIKEDRLNEMMIELTK